jgi:WD40 repeat protein
MQIAPGSTVAIKLMADGKTLATAGGNKAIRFWHIATWEEVSPPLMHKEVVVCLSISPNRI